MGHARVDQLQHLLVSVCQPQLDVTRDISDLENIQCLSVYIDVLDVHFDKLSF